MSTVLVGRVLSGSLRSLSLGRHRAVSSIVDFATNAAEGSKRERYSSENTFAGVSESIFFSPTKSTRQSPVPASLLQFSVALEGSDIVEEDDGG